MLSIYSHTQSRVARFLETSGDQAYAINRKRKAPEGGKHPPPTYLLMDGGKIYVSDFARANFLRQYVKDVDESRKLYFDASTTVAIPQHFICEVNGTSSSDIMRLWFDVDLKFKSAESTTKIMETALDVDGMVGRMSHCLIRLVRDVFPRIGQHMHISVIVDERHEYEEIDMSTSTSSSPTHSNSSRSSPSSRKAAKSSMQGHSGDANTPDMLNKPRQKKVTGRWGLHLHVPEIFVTNENHLKLLHGFVNRLHQELGAPSTFDLLGENWYDFVDETPLSPKKSLRFPGSFKAIECCKSKSCPKCKGRGYVKVETFYWPCVWFYEPLPPTDSPPCNVTSCPIPVQEYSTPLELMAFPLRHVKSLGEYDLIFLNTNRVNGPLIAPSEQLRETPLQTRRSATFGVEIPEDLVVRQFQKTSVAKKNTTNSTGTADVPHSTFVGDPLQFNRCDHGPYISAIETILRQATQKNFVPDSSPYERATPSKPKDTPNQSKPSDLTWMISTLRAQRPDHQPVKLINVYEKIEVNCVKVGMIANSKILSKCMVARYPITCHGSSVLDKFQKLPHLLSMYINPVKNQVSKQCVLKGGIHAQNNIYFHLLLPLVLGQLEGYDLEDTAHWTCAFLNGMLLGPESLGGVRNWPLTLRCFSDKNCKGRHHDYELDWPSVRIMVEPLLQELMAYGSYQKTSQGLFIFNGTSKDLTNAWKNKILRAPRLQTLEEEDD